MNDRYTGRQTLFLYGRDAELAHVRDEAVGVLVVAGDPGTGKSGLLQTAYEGKRHDTGALWAPLVPVVRRQGALQTALFDSLGRAVAEQAEREGTAERIGRVLMDAASRVAQTRLNGLARAAVGTVFGFVRDRLGDTVGDVLEDMAEQITTSLDEQLLARVTAAADRDVIDVFVTLAQEVAASIGSRVFLTVDDLDKLGEDDFRMLIDLVEAPPGDILLRLGHSTPDAGTAERVLRLQSSGPSVVRLGGLSEDVVAYWLVAEGIPQTELALLMHVTAGIPFYVDAALSHLKAGRRLSDLSIGESFDAQTQVALMNLDGPTQQASVLLCALTDRPRYEQILELLDCDAGDWLNLERRLSESRIFGVNVSGGHWFHELRRRSLWDHALSDQEREFSAAKSLEMIQGDLDDFGGTSLQNAIDLVRLSGYAPDFRAHSDSLETVLGIGHTELCVMASLVEISERANDGAVEAQSALSHARETFGAMGDLVSVLRELDGAGLIALAENDQAAIAVPVWGSHAAYAAVLGRVARELNRFAIPSIATATFDTFFRPALGEFLTAQYGVGRPTITNMSASLRAVDSSRDGFLAGERAVGIIARASLGTVDMYASVDFEDAEDRDAALAAMLGQRGEVLGMPFTLVDLLPWPAENPFPALRFVNAAGLILGTRGRHLPRDQMPTVDSLEEEAELRAQTYEVLASLATQDEARVLNLDRPRGLVFRSGESGSALMAEVSGMPGVRQADDTSNVFRPFFAVELAEAIGLGARQHIGRVNIRGGSAAQNPVIGIIGSTAEDLRKFNRAQGVGLRREFSLREEVLGEELQAAFDRASRDAIALLDAGLLPNDAKGAAYATYNILIHPGEAHDHWVEGARGSLTMSVVRGGNRNELNLVVRSPEEGPGPSMFGDARPMLENAFGAAAVQHEAWTSGVLIGLVAGLLGYDDQFIRLTRD